MMSEDDAKKFGSFVFGALVFLSICTCTHEFDPKRVRYTHATPEMGEVGAVKGERQLKFGAVSLSVLL